MHLETLFKKLRHVRTINELFEDSKFNKLPKKVRVASAFNMFCSILRNDPDMPKGKNFLVQASQRYKALQPEERAEYEQRAKEEKKLLKEQVSREAMEHDLNQQQMTPFILYCKEEVKKGNYSKCDVYLRIETLKINPEFLCTDKSAMKNQYRKFSDAEKMKYISQAVNEANNQLNCTVGSLSFLTKDEIRLMRGPTEKKLSAYNFFVKEFCQASGNNLKDAAVAYRNLSPVEKQKYIDMSEENKIAEKKKKDSALSIAESEPRVKTEKSDNDIPNSVHSDKKKRKSEPFDDDSFKSPTKRAPHAADTSIKSNGSSSKKRKVSESSNLGGAQSIKVEKKERLVEPERVPT